MKEIIIGQGLGPVKFGMTRDQVEALLGAPDEVEENVDIDEDLDEAAEAWHYDELEMSASFDMEDDWRLGMMAISSEDATLNGKALIGLNRNQLLESLQDMGFEDLVFEDWSDEEDEDRHLVQSDASAINFWLEEGVLTEIQWGPRYLDDETVDWPV
jgi:hypothetical protein